MISYIQNLKICRKLQILVGVALTGMLIIGASSFYLLGRMNGNTGNITTRWLPGLDTARQMNTVLSDIRLNELSYVTASDESQARQSLENVQKKKSELDALLTGYGEITDAGQRKFYDNSKELWSQYSKVDEKIEGLVRQGKAEEARDVLDGECEEIYTALSNSFGDIITYNAEGSDNITKKSKTIYHVSVAVMAVIIIAVIIIGMSLSFVIIRWIEFPIFEIEAAAVKMADGDLNAEITYQSQDELGVLSDQMRGLLQRLRAIINDENEFLGKMADGDFNVDSICEKEYVGEFEPVLASFRTIAKKLNETLLQISESSAQVASGAQALSQGATQQADSVEEFAATISEISEKIKENAENAQHASNMADNVSDKMDASNQKMQGMIQAMNEISQCMDGIDKIIKTIEDIAFKTNILALNAAVEAARAGAAGKGFAVVANEVRDLANQSAEASQNTAALIKNSLAAVKNGTAIASETADFLKNAVENVKEVTGIMSQISEASGNQATSVSQITQKIDQISSVVQENATAGEELSSQSRLMKDLAGKFQLKKDTRS